MALTKVTGQVINDTTGLVVGVTTVGGGISATDGFFSGIVTAVGNASFSGNVSVGGTLTYEDVTNIDAVGLVTAQNGIVVGSGITLSKDGDIFATGITTISENLKVGTGVTISPDGDIFFTGIMTGNGSGLTNLATDLVNDTTPQLGGNLDANDKNILIGDSASNAENRIRIGDSQDLDIFHDGNSKLQNSTGELRYQSDTHVLRSQSTSDTHIKSVDGGAVELYHDNSKKLETASGGVTVTGTVAATSFTGSGAALTGISAGITMMDQWSITSDNNKTDGQTIDTGWERSDYFFAQIGSGMSESSGIFTFPSTGIYLLMVQIQMNTSASSAGVKLMMSSNSGSDYSNVSHGEITNTNNGYHHMSLHAAVDVQDASTYRFKVEADNSGNVQYSGNSNALRNGVTFIRLGDT